jgi:hypothetical protein
LERLAKVREVFFPSDQSLGQCTITLTQQHNDPKYSEYRENARWTHGNLLFVTVHMVGSNKNLGRTREMDFEYAERNAANLAWMKEAFNLAKRNGNKRLVILTQANPAFENSGHRDDWDNICGCFKTSFNRSSRNGSLK